jgi:hypothetical protein
MSGKPIPLAEYVDDLRQTVTLASMNFDVWWTYKQRRDRARFVDVLNDYPLFFQTSLHAHFVAMIAALYRLYETRTDTFNLPQLLGRIEREKAVENRSLAGIKTRFRAARKAWVKVSVLRNNAFGHRSNRQSVTDVFGVAKVTPNELRGLIRRSKEIMNAISVELDGSIYAFNLRAQRDTRRVLTNLKRFDALRSNSALKGRRAKRARP